MRHVTLSEVSGKDRTSPSQLINVSLLSQEDLETQKRKTASAIVTSGALTLVWSIFIYLFIFLTFPVFHNFFYFKIVLPQVILAAALVTASFLMSPVIEDVFGE